MSFFTDTMIQKFKELFMAALAIIVVCIGVGLVTSLIVHSVPSENKDIITVSLGTVLAGWMQVINYYFGSSKSSADKSDTIKQLAATPEIASPKDIQQGP